MHSFDFMGGGWMMIFWWLLIIAAIIFFARMLISIRPNGKSEDTALDILKKRYASGEITKDEFEEKKNQLLN